MRKRLARASALAFCGAIVLAGLGSVLAAQEDERFFTTLSVSMDGAATAKYGEQFKDTLREMAEHAMFQAVKARYPCARYLDDSALKTMLDVERQRQLLGGSGEDRLPAIAQAVGAPRIGGVDIKVFGDTVSVGGVVVSADAAMAVARAQASGPVSNALALLGQMAQQLVGSLGAEGPRCGKWTGVIAVSGSRSETGKHVENGNAFTNSTNLSISCSYKEDQAEPKCQVSYSASLTGSGASTTSSAAGDARCVVGFGIANGTASIRVGPCEADGTYAVSVAGTSMQEKKRFSLGGWSHQYSVPSGTRTLTGAKAVDKDTTLTWSLSK